MQQNPYGSSLNPSTCQMPYISWHLPFMITKQIISPFYRWENWGSERLDRDTWQGGVDSGLSNSQVHCSFHSPVQPQGPNRKPEGRNPFCLGRGLTKDSIEEMAAQWNAVSFWIIWQLPLREAESRGELRVPESWPQLRSVFWKEHKWVIKL